MDLNLHHRIPDLSDTPLTAGPSEPSFQIPKTVGSSTQLLLEDDCSDFLAGMDSTLDTPAPPRSQQPKVHNPLTLAELTPRSKRNKPLLKYTPSARIPTLPSPLKRVVTQDHSTIIKDTLSPLEEPSDITFQIPKIGNDITQLLASESSLELFNETANYSILNSNNVSSTKPHELMALDQFTPARTLQSTCADTPSQHPAVQSSSTFNVQIGHVLDDKSPFDCSARESSSDDTPVSDVEPEVHEEISFSSSVDRADDQGVLDVGVLEGSPINSVRSVYPLAAPERTTRLSGRRSTGKQTVLAGGVTKRSGLASSTLTNALRSKAIGKRSVIAPNVARKHNVQGSQKVASSVSKASLPIRVTLKKASNLSRKALATGGGHAEAASSSHRQPGNDTTILSSDKSNFASLPTATHIFQSHAPLLQDLKPAYGNSAAVQPCPSSATSIPSTVVDRDLDQAFDDDTGVMTHNQGSPSDITSVVATADDLQPEVVHYADNILSSQPDPVELERDASSTTLTSSLTEPPSPIRRSSKRPAPVTPEDEVQTRSKRSRTSQSPQDDSQVASTSPSTLHSSISSENARPTTRVLRSSRVKNTSNAHVPAKKSSKSGPSVSRTAKTARTVRKPGVATRTSSRLHTVNTGGTTGRARQTRQLTASSTSEESRRSGSVTRFKSSLTKSDGPSNAEPHEPVSQQSLPTTRSKCSASLNGQHPFCAGAASSRARLAASLPAKATVPIGFNFHSEARIEARKRSEVADGKDASERAEEAAALGVPDFKALHDAEEKRLASRKPQIVPVLPGRLELSTEARAHEREKFDEGRRAREAEAERSLEEKRRLQAIEEEKEIKELRRRAVPKANEIPEWYAHAPKLNKPRDHQ